MDPVHLLAVQQGQEDPSGSPGAMPTLPVERPLADC